MVRHRGSRRRFARRSPSINILSLSEETARVEQIVQSRSFRVFTSSATSQIHASRSQKCLDPWTQSDSNKSSGDKLFTFTSFSRAVCKRSQSCSACNEEANKLDATPQCNSTNMRPSSRLNDKLCCVRRRIDCCVSVQGVSQINPRSDRSSLARSTSAFRTRMSRSTNRRSASFPYA